MADMKRWWSCGNCGHENAMSTYVCGECGDARCSDCRVHEEAS